MLDWLRDHQVLMYVLSGASVGLFVASLVLVPMAVVRMPADYFMHAHSPPARGWLSRRGPGVRLALKIAKNIAGYVLIIVGIVMIVLPGQGALTILVGFFMLDFPGKYRVEKWLLTWSWVNKPINWLRRKRHVEPLQIPGDPESSERSDEKPKAEGRAE